jgi:hypothetical protein
MRLALGGVPLMIVVLWSGSARSQEQSLQDKAAQLSRDALFDIEIREWDGAKKKLLESLVMENDAGLDTHPLMARTHVSLGVRDPTRWIEAEGLRSRRIAASTNGRRLDWIEVDA